MSIDVRAEAFKTMPGLMKYINQTYEVCIVLAKINPDVIQYIKDVSLRNRIIIELTLNDN